jgi:hypothetical protein
MKWDVLIASNGLGTMDPQAKTKVILAKLLI